MIYEYTRIIRAQSTTYCTLILIVGVLSMMCILNWAQYIQHESPVPDVKSCEGNASAASECALASGPIGQNLLLLVPSLQSEAEIKMFRCFPKRFLTADEVLKLNFNYFTLHSSSTLSLKKWPKQRRSRLLRSLLVSRPSIPPPLY